MLLFICLASGLTYAEGEVDVEHVILFVYDAFRYDYLAMYDLPNIESLVKEGVYYANARGVFPSTTTANQTSLVTGAYPNVTGIPNNCKYDKNQDRIIGHLRDVKVPTLSEVLKKADKKTVVLSHFMLENRQEEAYLDRSVYQFKKAIDNYNPDLIVYYDVRTDSYGHKYGPYSQKMKELLISIDNELGEMISFLEEKGIKEKTAIIIASDHGMTENTQPGVIVTDPIHQIEKAGFKIAANNAEIEDDTDIVLYQSGCSCLYLREGQVNEERYQSLLNILLKIPHLDVYTEKEIRALNADPEALGDIILVPHKGYSILAGNGGGIHGRPEEGQITLILSGAGVKKGIVKGEAEIIDVAPTIMELLNIEIPESVQGKILKGALKEKGIDWNGYF